MRLVEADTICIRDFRTKKLFETEHIILADIKIVSLSSVGRWVPAVRLGKIF